MISLRVVIGCVLATHAAATVSPDAAPAPPQAGSSRPSELRSAASHAPSDARAPGADLTRLARAPLDLHAPPDTARAAAHAEPDTEKPAAAGAEGSGHSDLAVKLQNPVADLISVPIQFNWDTGIGPGDDKQRITVNVQPVIPFSLNEDWNLISRTILPVVYAEGPVSGVSSEFGLGDTLQSLFFSPIRPIGGWIVGFGPAALLPTGTDDLFRSKQFALGPTGVVLKQDRVGDGTLTYGLLANHLWKVAGSDETPDVNATFFQPFVSYTLRSGTAFGVNTETTYDWTAEEWSVPINAFMSQLVVLGRQPVQFQFGGRYYADTVPDGPEWGIRFAVTFLFPK